MNRNDGRRLAGPLGAVFLLVVGCGVGFRDRRQPDAMSAEAHRGEAAEHAAEMREEREQYDPTASRRYPSHPYGSRSAGYLHRDFYWSTREYNPTESHLTHARKHERHVKEHIEAARVLEDFEEGQCRSFPPETRVACPLEGHVEAVEDVFDGVRIRLDERIDVNAAITHMRCHVAFARTRARIGMDSCPLYLPGVRVERVGTSRSVDLSVSDRRDLGDLRARARSHADLGSPG